MRFAFWGCEQDTQICCFPFKYMCLNSIRVTCTGRCFLQTKHRLPLKRKRPCSAVKQLKSMQWLKIIKNNFFGTRYTSWIWDVGHQQVRGQNQLSQNMSEIARKINGYQTELVYKMKEAGGWILLDDNHQTWSELTKKGGFYVDATGEKKKQRLRFCCDMFT